MYQKQKLLFTSIVLALSMIALPSFAQVVPDPATDLCTYGKDSNGVDIPGSLQCGDNAKAEAGAVAIGTNIVAGQNSIVIGSNTTVSGGNIAVGNNNTAGSAGTTIFGSDNFVLVGNSHGNNNDIRGYKNVNNLGNNNSINSTMTNPNWTTSNVGDDNYLVGRGNNNHGSENYVVGDRNVTQGNLNTVSGDDVIAIGNNVTAGFKDGVQGKVRRSVGIGEGVTINCDNGVAIGSGSTCDEDNTFSVGNPNGTRRKVTNVREGVNEYDVVVVKQIGPIANSLGGGASFNNGQFTGPTYTFQSGVKFYNVGDALLNLDSRVSNLAAAGPGPAGANGLSAYQIAVNNGFGGDESQWLESLKGQNGANGAQGVQGVQGDKGDQGVAGTNGTNGADGAQGIQGDKGDKGDQGVAGIPGSGSGGATGPAGADGVDGNDGVDGKDGAQGIAGNDGKDGVNGADGNDGTDGAKGDKGDQGIAGSKGDKGDKGDQGIAGKNGLDGASDELAVRYDTADKSSVTLASTSGAPTRLTGISNGRIEQGSTDAVNGGQIWELNDSWERRSKETNRNIEKMGAQSAALTMMSGANTYLPVGKVAIGAGVGMYGSETAIAVGAKVRSSERTSWSMGFSFSNGKAMGGVGFSVILD